MTRCPYCENPEDIAPGNLLCVPCQRQILAGHERTCELEAIGKKVLEIAQQGEEALRAAERAQVEAEILAWAREFTAIFARMPHADLALASAAQSLVNAIERGAHRKPR